MKLVLPILPARLQIPQGEDFAESIQIEDEQKSGSDEFDTNLSGLFDKELNSIEEAIELLDLNLSKTSFRYKKGQRCHIKIRWCITPFVANEKGEIALRKKRK